MKTFGKIFIWTSAALLVFWIVPWICGLITAKPYRTPFTLYSCVIHDFTALDRARSRDLIFVDREGREYGDTVQPLFYHTDLALRGMLPDSLEGRSITVEEIERNAFFLTSDPEKVNRRNPPVYLLMESAPARSELEDPEEAFVTRKDGLHLYKMSSNELLPEKSAAFNEALREAGFRFPAALLSGNPSTRKPYDEGYLLTDADGKLYQLKQADGKPVVRHFEAADGLSLKHLMITEFENRKTLGFLVDAENRMLMLLTDGSVIQTEVIFDPAAEELLVVGDLLYCTVKVSDASGERFYALDAEKFALADTLSRKYPEDRSFIRYLLPVRLSFTSRTDSYVKPRLRLGFR